jgi:hypothetical protein
MSECGQLLPSVPKENHAGNDRSQGLADVARYRKRGDEISEVAGQGLGPSEDAKLIERPLAVDRTPPIPISAFFLPGLREPRV